ncbi:MerR family transcriptional regulator [Nitrospina gracilis]|uniref:MerR family transcriptional regulator n=1 Tax=Nitrospina gracilis TaxID=35801 RepID=UPI0023512B72|nr:MerR family transcriptional regulator [Nitrospina gracilis]MCF8720740.1 DNA-binding transcriptional MerR regulator [Nitrospina gracilis Nb-211]
MDTFTRSELAKLVGVNKETLRYYETRDLIDPPLRSRSGYRLYSNEDAKRILFIKNAQKLGFSLDEIHEILSLQTAKKNSRQTTTAKAQEKRRIIDKRIDKLNQLGNAIDRMMEAWERNETDASILAYLGEGTFLSEDL